jgi:hypothetical protein
MEMLSAKLAAVSPAMLTAVFINMELNGLHLCVQTEGNQYHFLQYIHIYQGMRLPSFIFIVKLLLDL